MHRHRSFIYRQEEPRHHGHVGDLHAAGALACAPQDQGAHGREARDLMFRLGDQYCELGSHWRGESKQAGILSSCAGLAVRLRMTMTRELTNMGMYENGKAQIPTELING